MRDDNLRDDLPPPPHRPWWRRRLLLGAALAALLAGGGLVGLHVHLARQADRELEQAIAEVDEREPNGWRLEELEAQRAVIPDDRNAALVVMAVKKQMPNSWPSVPRPMPEPADRGEADDPPLPPSLPPEPIDERIGKLPPAIQLDEPLTDELRREMEKVFPALAEAQRLADLPTGRFPIVWAEDHLNTRLNSQQARPVANLLRMEAVLWAQDGHIDRAVRSARGMLNTGRAIGDEPTLISLLIRIALQAVSLASLERTLAQGEPSVAELEALQRLLEDEVRQPLLWIALRGERAGIYRTLEAMTNSRIPLSQLGRGSIPSFGEGFAQVFINPGLKRGNARLLRVLSEWIEVSKRPVEEQTGLFKLPQPASQRAGIEDIIVELLLPAIERVAEAFQRSQAKLRCGVTALAAERYRQAHGRWPDSLDELVQAKLLAAVPLDPYGGAPLRLRRTANGLVIYSISRDGQDNGGNLSDDSRAAGTDLGFQLWDVEKRRQPPHEWIPPPREGRPADDPAL